MKLLLYCTKAKPYLYPHFHNLYFTKNKDFGDVKLNGKIVGECDFEVEKINVLDCTFRTFNLVEKEILNKSCLTYHELFEYLKNRCNPRGYAIHIQNLHIFDGPKELSEVYKIEDVGGMLFTKPLTKAPQNMMRVSVNHWDYATYNPGDIRILISIRPEWLCKILNGEKTIEVRKKVLKEMLKNE